MTANEMSLERRGEKIASEIANSIKRNRINISNLLNTAISAHTLSLRLFYYTIKLRFQTYNLVRDFHKLENTIDECFRQSRSEECEGCPFLEKYLPSLINDIREHCELIRSSIKKMQESGISEIIIKIHQGSLLEMEDIAENIMIATDREIRHFISEIPNSNACQ